MSTANTPTLNGQVIGMAHYATRAVFERFLASLGMSFQQSVVLGRIDAAVDAPGRDEIVRQAAFGLKVADDAVLATLDELADQGLTTVGTVVQLTDAGRQRTRLISEHIAVLAEQLYGDLATDDLAAVARVLATVTDRANAALAS